MSDETVDGENVISDQLVLSNQTSLCDGKPYQEVISEHPDIRQGTHSHISQTTGWVGEII